MELATENWESTLIVAIHQPNYIPGISYFAKIMRSDIFILLDTVQYSKRNWTNRNRIKSARGEVMLTVPVITKNLSLQNIFEVRIDPNGMNWPKKHLKSLQHNYSRAPYSSQYLPKFEAILSCGWKSLAELNIWIIRELCAWLNLPAKVIRASDLAPTDLSSTDLLVHLTREVGGDSYLSGQGGRKYMETEKFCANKIKLNFSYFTPEPYRQQFGEFISNLSIVDLLFNEGPNALKILQQSGHIAS
jgi:hypothetical protein